MATAAKTAPGHSDGFMPPPAATRGQTLVGALCILLLVGAFIASATVTFACAGLSSCQTGATEQAQAGSLGLRTHG